MSEQPRDPIEEMSQRRVAGRDGSGFLAELRRLGLQNLLPWRIWLRDRPWDLVLVRWLLFFTLAPLPYSAIAPPVPMRSARAGSMSAKIVASVRVG